MKCRQIKSLGLILALVVTGTALGQGAGGNRPDSPPGLLDKITGQEQADLMRDKALEIRLLQYFAKPGQFGIYKVDLTALETPGQSFFLDLPDGQQIEVMNNFIDPDWGGGGLVSRWVGSIRHSNEDRVFPVEITTEKWAITPDGKWVYPDPGRERTLAAIEKDVGVISADSYERLDEKQVRIINPVTFAHPSGQSQIILRPIKGDYEHVMLYEEDADKRLWLRGGGEEVDPENPWQKEANRRLGAYEAHEAMTRRQLGLPAKKPRE